MIPVFDIKRQNQEIGREIKTELLKTLDKGAYILGDKVAGFEKEFAKYLGIRYAIGVASGTDAISLSLLALGIKPGDGVILPANSYPSVFAVTTIGAVPQLVDINRLTYTIDPNLIPKTINNKTKAILPVHLYGQPADMETILKIGKQFGLPVVEDCAQAHGAECRITYQVSSITGNKGKTLNTKYVIRNTKNQKIKDDNEQNIDHLKWIKVGNLGSCGCFSFYPTKNLGCFGDGGIVVTNDDDLARRVKLLRMYGEESRYKSVLVGRNSRLDEIQAAILSVKLKYLDRWNDKRRKLASFYFSTFHKFPISLFAQRNRRKKGHPQWKFAGFSNLKQSGGPLPEAELGATPRLLFGKENDANVPRGLLLPTEANYARHIYHLFVIRTIHRDKLKAYLAKKGIQTAIHYPVPIHLIPSMKYLGYKKGDFPESEKASEEVLSLPMFPELKEEEISTIAEAIISYFSTS